MSPVLLGLTFDERYRLLCKVTHTHTLSPSLQRQVCRRYTKLMIKYRYICSINTWVLCWWFHHVRRLSWCASLKLPNLTCLTSAGGEAFGAWILTYFTLLYFLPESLPLGTVLLLGSEIEDIVGKSAETASRVQTGCPPFLPACLPCLAWCPIAWVLTLMCILLV